MIRIGDALVFTANSPATPVNRITKACFGCRQGISGVSTCTSNPKLQYTELVGEDEDLGLIAGDVDNRCSSFARHGGYFDAELLATDDVKFRKRLVNQNEPDFGFQRASQGDALLLAV